MRAWAGRVRVPGPLSVNEEVNRFCQGPSSSDSSHLHKQALIHIQFSWRHLDYFTHS